MQAQANALNEAGTVSPGRPLDRFVGSWVGEVTVTEAGKAATYPQRTTFSWVLGGHFLQEVGGYGDTLFRGFWTLDPNHGYRSWYFISPGPVAAMAQVEWDERSQTFLARAQLENGLRAEVTDRFLGMDAYEWRMTFRDPAGTVVSETFGVQRREQ